MYMFPVAVARSSFDVCAISYVLSVLWMTSRLPYWAIWRVADRAYILKILNRRHQERSQNVCDFCLVFKNVLKEARRD